MVFKKITLAASAALAGALFAPSAAQAQYVGDGYYERGYYQPVQHRYRPGDYYGERRGYRRGYDRRYDRRRYERRYRGRYCRDDGDTGTIIGAIAGGLLGHEVAEGRRGRGDGTAGAIIGGVAGALAGRAIDRDC